MSAGSAVRRICFEAEMAVSIRTRSSSDVRKIWLRALPVRNCAASAARAAAAAIHANGALTPLTVFAAGPENGTAEAAGTENGAAEAVGGW